MKVRKILIFTVLFLMMFSMCSCLSDCDSPIAGCGQVFEWFFGDFTASYFGSMGAAWECGSFVGIVTALLMSIIMFVIYVVLLIVFLVVVIASAIIALIPSIVIAILQSLWFLLDALFG